MLRRLALCLSLAVAAAFGLAASCVAAPTDLDRTFGKRGIATVPGFGPVTSLIALRDGRYLGTTGDLARNGPASGSLFALRPLGALDPTFGSGGRADFAAPEFARGAIARGVLRQPGGKFVVWGGHPLGRPSLRLVRYTRDGVIDRSFGSDGRVEAEEGQPGGVIARPDGSLVGTLQTCDPTVAYVSCTVTLFALTPDGAVDRSFGTNGSVANVPHTSSPPGGLLAADRQGRILLAYGTEPGNVSPDSTYVHVARYNANGSRDTGFGRDTGVLLIGPDHVQTPADMLVQKNGKIVLLTNSEKGATVTRLTPNGARDDSFGSRGRISVGKVHLTALALQRNGKLLAAGTANLRAAFALFRFTADGRLDIGFGQRGRVFTTVDLRTGDAHYASDVAVDPAGTIVVAGGVGYPDLYPALVRYKGGRGVSPPAPRYSVRVRGGGKRLQVGERLRVGLSDRLHRNQRLEVCGLPITPTSEDPFGCVRDLRTGERPTVRVPLRQPGKIELRFRIRSTGETIFRTLRVHRR
jgi:uncharacterized delta-60 repeat protein